MLEIYCPTHPHCKCSARASSRWSGDVTHLCDTPQIICSGVLNFMRHLIFRLWWFLTLFISLHWATETMSCRGGHRLSVGWWLLSLSSWWSSLPSSRSSGRTGPLTGLTNRSSRSDSLYYSPAFISFTQKNICAIFKQMFIFK